ncbi:MAG: hypothetical protein CME38_03440 [Haliea sp.]|nr:hypothetical protein [Haliea sp.]
MKSSQKVVKLSGISQKQLSLLLSLSKQMLSQLWKQTLHLPINLKRQLKIKTVSIDKRGLHLYLQIEPL